MALRQNGIWTKGPGSTFAVDFLHPLLIFLEKVELLCQGYENLKPIKTVEHLCIFSLTLVFIS